MKRVNNERPSVEEGRYDGYRMYLRNQRIRCGYTQEYVAKKLHVTRECIAQWERGARQPSFEMCVKIKELLNCDSIDKIMETYVYRDKIFIGCLGNKEIGIQ